MRRLVALLVMLLGALSAPAASGRVLLVGTYHGLRGGFTSVQAAVDAAHAGDWVLVGPGDYKERADHRRNRGPQPADTAAGVVIAKAGLHLRGMNRNSVVIDGTAPGSGPCSTGRAAQDFGPAAAGGLKRLGRNGILVWKARNVWVENLTVCNFLGGSGNAGNEIWWNGGDGSGKIGGHGYVGSYLSTTSTFFRSEDTAAKYGLFTSNWSGGVWDHIYGSNFNDSAFYIGACQQACDQVIAYARAQYNALGYSGSNSGGELVIENSEFDHNKDGFDTNSQNGDNPPPQNGACPHNRISPITHTHSCWVFMNNYVHDNNNPNVPFAGAAGAGPVGTGMSISGARNDTVMNNRFVNNKAWGVIIVPYTDSGPPCTGGTVDSPVLGKGTCLYDEYGIALKHNTFTANGGYGNPTNGAFDQLNLEKHPTNCYSQNSGVLSADAKKLEKNYPACTGAEVPANLNVPFLNEVLCDSQVKLSGFGCQPGDHYPRRTRVIMHPLPHNLSTMPDPCQGVPANPWCAGRRRGARGA